MSQHPTDLQRQFAEGRLVLPDVRPAGLDERAWAALVRHVRDRVPYGELAREVHLEPNGVRRLAVRAAAALRHPELADLLSGTRRSLILGGYTTREAIAQASDADLLRLRGMRAVRLREVRAVIPSRRHPPQRPA